MKKAVERLVKSFVTTTQAVRSPNGNGPRGRPGSQRARTGCDAGIDLIVPHAQVAAANRDGFAVRCRRELRHVEGSTRTQPAVHDIRWSSGIGRSNVHAERLLLRLNDSYDPRVRLEILASGGFDLIEGDSFVKGVFRF